MTTLRSGSTQKYAEGWDRAFGKANKKGAAQATTKRAKKKKKKK